MTNSNRDKPSTTTGTTGTITPATEAEFVSNRGTEFEIATANNGMFFIKMKKGGVAPSFTAEMFTSRQEAAKVLERYLRQNDRLGNAKFPSKGK